jgi:hypothetical protein
MSTALATFKREHGVATHRLAGAGHRYAWMAFFTVLTLNDGSRRAFTDLAAEYSMAALIRRDKVAEGADELSACIALASANSIPWPADEPKRKAKP